MRWALPLVLALLCALPAAPLAAQTVSFRSGQHPDFVRLVLAIPEGADWRLGRDGGDYVFTLPGATFDTAGVFARIRRDRLAALEARPGRLRLKLSCDTCHARAFLWRPDRLVIDIRDGEAPAGSGWENPIAPPAQDARSAGGGADLVLPLLFDDPALPAASPPLDAPQSDLPLLPETAAEPDLLNPFQEPPATRRVQAAQSQILDTLSRAAAQGLLTVDPDAMARARRDAAAAAPPAPDPAPSAPASAPDAPPDAARPPFAASSQPRRPGLDVRSSIDSATGRAAPPQERSRCLDDALFDVRSWIGEGEFSDEITARSTRLTDEAGGTDPGAALALARSYLAFGFGREALGVLRIDDRRSVERQVLSTMAAIVDGDPLPGRPFTGQQGCTGPVALWRALAAGSIVEMTPSERTGLLTGFSLLPEALRGHLAPRVAQLFIDADDPLSAEAVLSEAFTAPDGHSVEAELTAAELTLQSQGPQEAIEDLAQLAEEDARMTPEGLIRLIELELAEGRPVPEDQLDLARAMRFEARGTPVEAALAAVEARALIASGRHEMALSLLRDESGEMGAAQRRELRAEAVEALTETLPDAEFIDRIYAGLPPITAEAENRVAERLLQLGFAERAADLVSGGARGEAMAARRLLRAEAALALEDPDEVLRALGGVAGEAAATLRAEALRMQGDSTAALAEAAQVAPPAPRDLWRAGAWDGLAEAAEASADGEAAVDAEAAAETALLQRAGEAARREQPPLAAEASLAEGRDLLEQAEEARRLAEDLLSRFPLEDREDPATP
ncbi:hypothetical protein [Pseudoroseicyclus aestuarii]|uniref:Uncharacterized protein n=1 Tax=Pseudoroseicyclus aestuarii TaxID=1795041 RepID=A0A318SRZ2_9RHOB|nr:hypothetical protein [Pseudoroseicyclus aestuarii]PYE84590.1 hypothetical protein DFP88_102391 [Pseudoroseicyclus aestuarii]